MIRDIFNRILRLLRNFPPNFFNDKLQEREEDVAVGEDPLKLLQPHDLCLLISFLLILQPIFYLGFVILIYGVHQEIVSECAIRLKLLQMLKAFNKLTISHLLILFCPHC